MGKFRRSLAFVPAALALAIFTPAEERASAPLVFALNQGQCAPEILFQARTPGLVASVLADGLQLDLEGVPLRLRFAGADAARAHGLERTGARLHFLGAAASTRDVPAFARVRLEGLYPGVDLELYENDGRIEYDLLLTSDADEAQLALRLEGAESVTLTPEGALLAQAGGRSFRQLAPVAWQVQADGSRAALPCVWQARADGSFGFSLAGRTRGARLVIDPVLVYSSYVGGSNADEATDVFVDEEGCTYVTGWARSVDFPVSAGGPLGTARGKEGVVFKLGPDGRELIYATYFGGRGDDMGAAIQVTPAGQAIVAGTTLSADFPTSAKAFQPRASGGTDGFLLRLAPDGSALEFATLLGGSAEDVVADLALGASGQITVAGTTRSRDFPTSSASYCVEPRGARDAFVLRLDPQGERLLYSTLLGGSEDDECRGLALDAEGSAYVVGRTLSHDFPTTLAAFDRERTGADAFVAKLSGGGRSLLFATFLGGSGADEATAVAVDAERRAVVVGWTQSLDFPFDAGTQAPGRKDGFAVRLSATGNALSYARVLGGGSADEALGVTLGPQGTAWIVGRTRSSDFPTTRDAHRARAAGAGDAFLVRLAAEEGRLLYATYLGGEGEDQLCAVHTDIGGTTVVMGGSADGIPSEQRGVLAGKRRGPSDAFVLRFDPHATAPSSPSMQAGLKLGF